MDYSSTTHSVLQSITLYYSVLQSTTPVLLQYYSVLQSTTVVLLCTTKYYYSTTLYYRVLLQYYSVLQSTTPVLLRTTKYYASTTLYYSSSSTSSSTSTSASTSTSSTSTAPAPAPAPPHQQHKHQHHQQHHQHQQHQHQRQHQHQHQHPRTSTTSTSIINTSSTSTTSTTKISILLQFRATYTHNSTKGLHAAPPDRNFTTVSRDRHVQSCERVAPSTARSQFYYSFARSTRTILRKGCAQHRKIAISLQFRAIDTYDLTKGFIGLRQDRNFTTVSRDRHVRSYERVHRAGKKSSNYYSFARSTRTILREGCISASIFRTMAAPPP